MYPLSPKNQKFLKHHSSPLLIHYYPKYPMNPMYHYFQLFQSFLKLLKYHLLDH
jgi:hypothetical protein